MSPADFAGTDGAGAGDGWWMGTFASTSRVTSTGELGAARKVKHHAVTTATAVIFEFSVSKLYTLHYLLGAVFHSNFPRPAPASTYLSSQLYQSFEPRSIADPGALNVRYWCFLSNQKTLHDPFLGCCCSKAFFSPEMRVCMNHPQL